MREIKLNRRTRQNRGTCTAESDRHARCTTYWRRCSVRKLLTCWPLLATGLFILSTGCGSSPTAPTSTGSTQTSSGSPTPTPAPEPSPAPAPPPTPEPSPAPTPTPPPAPAPTPAPAPPAPGSPAQTWTFDASTSQAYWAGTPTLPDRFELAIMNGSVQAGGHSFPILSQAPGNVYIVAGTRNEETLTLEYYGPTDGSGTWRWTYNGLPGQATGTLQRHR